MNLVARLVSGFSNPLIISIPASFFLVFKISGSYMYTTIWALLSSFFVGLVAIFVFYGVKRGFFSDYDVSKRQERTALFAFTGFISLLYFIVAFLLNGPRILLIGLGVLLFGIFLAQIINKKIKASIHLAAFSAFLIIVGILYGGIFWMLLMLIPVVAWSRIMLKKHVLSETIVGTILGTLLVIGSYFIIKYIYPL